VKARRQPGAKKAGKTKKAKAPVRAKSKVASKKAVSKKPARRPAPPTAKKKLSPRKPSKAASTMAVAEVERGVTTPAEPEPQAFWDPKGGQSEFRGDAKAHTKPEDQRAHIRMQAPRTWSNRQRGRG
jgi:hypothetical protein